MKIGIVYATQREEATVKVVDWMKCALEEKGSKVVAAKPQDFNAFDCDAYIIGSAAYGLSVKRNGVDVFLKANRQRLAGRPVHLFIVCGAVTLEEQPPEKDNFFLKLLKKTVINSDKYIKSLAGLLPAPPVSRAKFKGYKDAEDMRQNGFLDQEQRVRDWAGSCVKA